MDQKTFEALQVDAVEIETAFAGREEIYIKYLKRFPADGTFAELRKAVSEKKLPDVVRAAHAFKGLCATLRLTRLYEMARETVDTARQGKIEEVEERMPELTEEYNKVILCIERYT